MASAASISFPTFQAACDEFAFIAVHTKQLYGSYSGDDWQLLDHTEDSHISINAVSDGKAAVETFINLLVRKGHQKTELDASWTSINSDSDTYRYENGCNVEELLNLARSFKVDMTPKPTKERYADRDLNTKGAQRHRNSHNRQQDPSLPGVKSDQQRQWSATGSRSGDKARAYNQ